jgi:hypothetical protein
LAGKPGVLITTDEFLANARSSAHDNGMPLMRAIGLPAKTYYRARGNVKEVRPVVAAALSEITSALTSPLTSDEANPKPKPNQVVEAKIKVTGVDYADAAERLNQLFLRSHWADGLPILPPTEKAVASMLKGPAGLPGSHRPCCTKNGQATIEKIAINSVMAEPNLSICL